MSWSEVAHLLFQLKFSLDLLDNISHDSHINNVKVNHGL